MFNIGGPLFDGSEGEAKSLSMNPVGPVSARFVQDRSYITTIMGPYGSGKTTSCFQKIIWATMWQNPGPDGVRRSRGVVVRDTYQQLKSNVMNDFFAWFKKDASNFNGEDMVSVIDLEVPMYGRLHIEILWRALGDDRKPEDLFKGLALTWIWMNECDTLRKEIIRFGVPRLGRYPLAKDGGCQWCGLWGDMNAPEVTNWTYELLVEKKMMLDSEALEHLRAVYGDRFRVSFHQQPAGDAPDAENLENLPGGRGYYVTLMVTLTPGDVLRFVKNKFGAVRSGQPVYPEYNDQYHCATEEFQPVAGIDVQMGIDGGRTPAIVFFQDMPSGQIRVFDELVIFTVDEDDMLEKMGPKAFADDARRFLSKNYPSITLGIGWSDPAAGYGDDGPDAEDLVWRDDFAAHGKFKLRDSPVPGNRFTPRVEAVRDALTKPCGNQPGLLISPRCSFLRRGFNNGYVWERKKLSNGSKVLDDKVRPDKKNPFTHVHDALQYGVYASRKRAGVAERLDRDHANRNQGSVANRRGRQKFVKVGGYAGVRS